MTKVISTASVDGATHEGTVYEPRGHCGRPLRIQYVDTVNGDVFDGVTGKWLSGEPGRAAQLDVATVRPL